MYGFLKIKNKLFWSCYWKYKLHNAEIDYQWISLAFSIFPYLGLKKIQKTLGIFDIACVSSTSTFIFYIDSRGLLVHVFPLRSSRNLIKSKLQALIFYLLHII